MLSVEELRQQLRAVTPAEALEHLAHILKSGKRDDIMQLPLLEIHLVSGNSFRGYIVDCGGERDTRAFLFSREIRNEGDDAADVLYVYGSRIEALTIWNIDDYPGVLPRPK